jgi:hypothetical protein
LILELGDSLLFVAEACLSHAYRDDFNASQAEACLDQEACKFFRAALDYN